MNVRQKKTYKSCVYTQIISHSEDTQTHRHSHAHTSDNVFVLIKGQVIINGTKQQSVFLFFVSVSAAVICLRVLRRKKVGFFFRAVPAGWFYIQSLL